jgi:hypothetical protein
MHLGGRQLKIASRCKAYLPNEIYVMIMLLGLTT